MVCVGWQLLALTLKSNDSNKWMSLWIIYFWGFTSIMVEFFLQASLFDIPKFLLWFLSVFITGFDMN